MCQFTGYSAESNGKRVGLAAVSFRVTRIKIASGAASRGFRDRGLGRLSSRCSVEIRVEIGPCGQVAALWRNTRVAAAFACPLISIVFTICYGGSLPFSGVPSQAADIHFSTVNLHNLAAMCIESVSGLSPVSPAKLLPLKY